MGSLDVLIVGTAHRAGPIIQGLSSALGRSGCKWAIFLTHEAVRVAGEAWYVEATRTSTDSIVCEESWRQYMRGIDCQVTLGSQTNNSELVGRAARVISL